MPEIGPPGVRFCEKPKHLSAKEEGGSQRLPQRRLGDGGVSSREDRANIAPFGKQEVNA
jgi:hypothetical protein